MAIQAKDIVKPIMSDIYSGLFESKLRIPIIPENYIYRKRLAARFRKGLEKKLTLISAPAGFGKTSALALWLNQTKCSYIWYTSSKEDNDIIHFTKYILHGLQQVKEGFGSKILETLQVPASIQVNDIVMAMIKELEDFPEDIILAIDDYHLIQSQQIDDAFSFLLNHMPHQLHIYIATRVDPPIPLARLRVSAELNEIRTSDLKFSYEESEAFLSSVMKIGLPEKEMRTLYNITEGWAAGLRMVGHALGNREDPNKFIDTVGGTHRDISDYFEEEVFSLQSKDTQHFLLCTSILTSLTPSLCNAVTGKTDGSNMLKTLEQLNLFLTALDRKRQWYRYHPFFCDMLYERLKSSREDLVPILHQKASQWYLAHHLPDEAISHASAAKDFALVAFIIEREGLKLMESGEFVTLDNWLKTLPEDLLLDRPQLIILKAAVCFLVGARLEEFKYYTNYIEQELLPLAEKESSHSPESGNRTHQKLLGQIYFAKGVIATTENRFDLTREFAEKSLIALSAAKDDSFFSVLATFLLASSMFFGGRLEDGERHLRSALSLCRRKKNIFLSIFTTAQLALVEYVRGNIGGADALIDESMEQYKDRLIEPLAIPDPVGILLIIKGEILREKNQLSEAEDCLLKGIRMSTNIGPIQTIGFGYIALSRVMAAKGKLKDSMEILSKVENTFWPMNRFMLYTLPAYKALLYFINGDAAIMNMWLHTSRLEETSISTFSNISKYFEFNVYARYLIDTGNTTEALDTLREIRQIADAEGCSGSLIEALVLSAIACNTVGDKTKADSFFQQALRLAEPRGYVRVFIDQGRAVTALLLEAVKNHKNNAPEVSLEYLVALLRASGFDPEGKKISDETLPDKLPWQYRLDPLSNREIEVLKEVSNGMSNIEIAEKLCISVGTVKTHVHRILSKLYAENRIKAVIVAKKMGLC